jgi:uncharacterized protein Smg (DUF494 family)
LEERIMHIVSLIAGQVCSRGDLFAREGHIVQSLVNDGYLMREADAALTLMQVLARRSDDRAANGSAPALRVMGVEERSRFAVEAFGLVLKLSHLGIMDDDRREQLLDRAMALHDGRIDLADIKALLAADLLAGAPELAELLDAPGNQPAGTAWN